MVHEGEMQDLRSINKLLGGVRERLEASNETPGKALLLDALFNVWQDIEGAITDFESAQILYSRK